MCMRHFERLFVNNFFILGHYGNHDNFTFHLNVQDDDKPGDQKPKGKKRPKAMQKQLSSSFHISKKRLLFFWPPEVAGFKKRSKNRPRKPAKKTQREPPY